MQLVEVKNDIAKIIYNPVENHLLPSDFILIEDMNHKLISQIVNVETTQNSNNNIADLKLYLSIDKEDNLSFYNGYIPSKDSKVMYIHPDEILELIRGNDDINIYFGNLANHSQCFVKTSLSCINDKLYIVSDRADTTKIVVQNIVSELYSKNKKIILLDLDGRYKNITNVPRVKITDSFKLPLNSEALNTILQFDTVDCPIEDKAVIQSIVLELKEYLSTLENQFLPFTLFKTVVDNEFSSNPISGLMLLRNKLWLYSQESIFAENKFQYEILNKILENQNIVIIDASSIEEKWYKLTVQTILNLINKHSYFILSLNDILMDRKSLINLFNTPLITPIVSTSYDNRYRQILKSVCKNQILFKPSKYDNGPEASNLLLNKINQNEFILSGESTLNLPMLIELQPFNSSTAEKVVENDIKKDVDNLFSSPNKMIPRDVVITEIVQTEAPENFDDVEEFDSFSGEDFNDDDLDFIDDNKSALNAANLSKTKITQNAESVKYDVFTPIDAPKQKIVEDSKIEILSGIDDRVQEEESIENQPDSNSNIDILDNLETLNDSNEKDIVPKNIEIESKPVVIEEVADTFKMASDVKTEQVSMYDNMVSVVDGNSQNTDIHNEGSVTTSESDDILDTYFITDSDDAEVIDSSKEYTQNEQLVHDDSIVLIEDDSTEQDNLQYVEEAVSKSSPDVVDNDFENNNDLLTIDSVSSIDSEIQIIETDVSQDGSSDNDYSSTIQSIEDDPEIEVVDVTSLKDEKSQNDEINIVAFEEENSDIHNEETEIIQDESVKDEQLDQAEDNVEVSTTEDDDDVISIEEAEEISSLDSDENEMISTHTDDNLETTSDEIEVESEPEFQDETVNLKESENTEVKVVEMASIDELIDSIRDKNASDGNAFNQSQTTEAEVKTNDVEVKELPQKTKQVKKEVKNPPKIKEKIDLKKTTKLPLYETDTYAVNQPEGMPFKVGDKVYHPKHGYGIVEGFANYSNKILFCQIEFENVGRRILDPRISGIEKVS